MLRTACTLAPFLLAGAIAGTAASQTLVGPMSSALWHVDYDTGSTQLIGSFTLKGGQFDPKICRAPDGSLFGIANAFFGVPNLTLYRFDETTGAATPLHDMPLGSDFDVVEVHGVAVHPVSGRVYFQLNNVIRSIDPVSGQLSAPLFLPGGGTSRGLAFAPDGSFYTLRQSTSTSSYRLWRIDLDAMANSAPIGIGLAVPMQQLVYLTYDASVNSLVGYAWGAFTGQLVFPIDAIGGFAGSVTFWSVAPGVPVFTNIAGRNCTSLSRHGTGCSAGAAATPELLCDDCPEPGNSVAVTIKNGLGGSTALLAFGSTQGSTPLGAGCTLLVHPVPLVLIPIPLGGAGPTGGKVTLSTVLPASASGTALTMQAFVLDPSSAIGATATDALVLEIP